MFFFPIDCCQKAKCVFFFFSYASSPIHSDVQSLRTYKMGRRWEKPQEGVGRVSAGRWSTPLCCGVSAAPTPSPLSPFPRLLPSREKLPTNSLTAAAPLSSVLLIPLSVIGQEERDVGVCTCVSVCESPLHPTMLSKRPLVRAKKAETRGTLPVQKCDACASKHVSRNKKKEGGGEQKQETPPNTIRKH